MIRSGDPWKVNRIRFQTLEKSVDISIAYIVGVDRIKKS